MNWRIQVLGRLAVTQGSTLITRFESRKVAVLLAYLALHPGRAHPREELVEMLWPEVEPETGRQRLRQALSSLRRQLEPPGTPYGAVLMADRFDIQLNPDAFTCDAADLERRLRQRRYREAKALYAGELLPGFYEEWILTERYRLEALVENLPDTPDEADPVEGAAAKGEGALVLLPVYLTAFFGREEERAALPTLLGAHRLVTITGMGGSGKTRLAVEAARLTAPDYALTAFVPLAQCASPDQIVDHIRTALGLPASTVNALDQVKHVLAGRKTLLVLDNFEQLVDSGGALVVETLLAQLPTLTCLVTTRRLLGISGEQERPLAPFPDPPENASLADTAQSPGIALFVNRAREARPDFQLTTRNRSDLVALCRDLEGVPLALELAASRIRVLSPSEMRAQMTSRLEWLVRSGPGADKQPRHRSLLATLEWSWRLLSPHQQRFLAALTVFRGGWSAEAAASVCEKADARERLEALVMDSLLFSQEGSDGATRFSMLEAIRAFVQERFPVGERSELRARHRAFFLELANAPEPKIETLQVEAANLTEALETAIQDNDVESAFRLCLALDDRWLMVAGAQTALALLGRSLALEGGQLRARLETFDLASNLALMIGNTAAAEDFIREAFRLAAAGSAERASVLVMEARVSLLRFTTTPETPVRLREALALARQADAKRVEASALRLLALLASRRGDLSEAQQNLNEGIALFQAANDRKGIVYARDNLANTYMILGDLEQALALYFDCKQRAEALGDFVYQAKVYQNLATAYARQRRWNEAVIMGLECIRRNHALGNVRILCYALWNLPEPLIHLGKAEMAVPLLGFAEHFWIRTYGPLSEADRDYCDDMLALAAVSLGESQTAGLRDFGAQWTLPQAVTHALS